MKYRRRLRLSNQDETHGYLSVASILFFVASLLALVAALAPNGRFFAYGFKPIAQTLKPGRKYTMLERMQPERLRAVHEDRLRYQKARKQVALRADYQDFRGVLHAH